MPDSTFAMICRFRARLIRIQDVVPRDFRHGLLLVNRAEYPSLRLVGDLLQEGGLRLVRLCEREPPVSNRPIVIFVAHAPVSSSGPSRRAVQFHYAAALPPRTAGKACPWSFWKPWRFFLVVWQAGASSSSIYIRRPNDAAMELAY